MVKQNLKGRCSNCNSSQTYFRQKTRERVCKQCSYIEKVSDEELKRNNLPIEYKRINNLKQFQKTEQEVEE